MNEKIDKEKISSRIRALFSKTVENGCTEDEAIKATEKAYELLNKYNLSMEDIEIKEEEIKEDEIKEDFVFGPHMMTISGAIAYLMDIKCWRSSKGEVPSVTFFGMKHEVEIAGYILDICMNTMKRECSIFEKKWLIIDRRVRNRKVNAFLDGMANSMSKKIMSMKNLSNNIGSGIVVLKNQLIEEELQKRNIFFKKTPGRKFNFDDSAYEEGVVKGDELIINKGIGADFDNESVKLLNDC